MLRLRGVTSSRSLAPALGFKPSAHLPSLFSTKAEDDCECQTEPREPLGRVGGYDAHLLVHTGTSDWPSVIELSDSDYGRVAKELKKAVKITDNVKVKVSATTAPVDGEGVTVTAWPSGRTFTGVKSSDAQAVLRDVLFLEESGVNWRPAKAMPHVYVCIHNARDTRCGTTGGAVLKELGNVNGIEVHGCSHVGGHQFAGNVIVHPVGKWFGYVSTEHASTLGACIAENRIDDEMHDHVRGTLFDVEHGKKLE